MYILLLTLLQNFIMISYLIGLLRGWIQLSSYLHMYTYLEHYIVYRIYSSHTIPLISTYIYDLQAYLLPSVLTFDTNTYTCRYFQTYDVSESPCWLFMHGESVHVHRYIVYPKYLHTGVGPRIQCITKLVPAGHPCMENPCMSADTMYIRSTCTLVWVQLTMLVIHGCPWI